MNPDTDTPPDGDFARYVEQLGARAAAAAQVREERGGVPVALGSVSHAGATARREPAGLVEGRSVWPVVRWALVAWIALQILEVFFPRVGLLSFPLFLAVTGWVLYRFKQGAGVATGDKLRRLAERAAKEFNQRKQN